MKLPRDIVKKYGISKKAWAVYRSRGGGRKSRRNPSRSTHRRRRSGRKSSHRRHRRNPTGYPFSGSHYRPNYRSTRSGRGYHARQRARSLPSYVGVSRRRGGSHRKHRRSGRKSSHRKGHRNPFGHQSFGRGSMGSVRNAVPLLRPRADFAMMRAHPIGSLAFGGVSFFFGGVMGSAGGTLAILGEGFLVAVALRYILRGRSGGKYAYIAPAWAAGAVAAALAHVLSTGSLTGSARLGQTMANLQQLAAQVKSFGAAPSLQAWGLKGLTGSTSLKGLRLALPAGLKGLGVGADLRKLSTTTLTGLGDSSPQGWSYSP